MVHGRAEVVQSVDQSTVQIPEYNFFHMYRKNYFRFTPRFTPQKYEQLTYFAQTGL